MRTFFFSLFILTMFSQCQTPAVPMKVNYKSFDEYPVYAGNDLGVTFTREKTVFKLWSPAADAVDLSLYDKDLESSPIEVIQMQRTDSGVWTSEIKKNLEGKYYTYTTTHEEKKSEPTADPYSVACGRNGLRSQIIDLNNTNPTGWKNDKHIVKDSPNDMVIYEIHVRDMSIHPKSGIENKGKFIGLSEDNTQTDKGIPTGLAHLKKMGVTHVHLLPSFDFRSIDETLPEAERNYNWGYDPHLYNVPEGTYATDPENGAVRVKEFKQMVQTLHEAGIGLILDVVYNHTGATDNSVFNTLVPGYYYRQNEEGGFSDASACGNETASERPMMRNFIVNSVKYWAQEYHLDGFRFDLMGIHDIETMNAVTDALHAINPGIFVYGEGWTAGGSPLPDSLRALKHNVPALKATAAFSDEARDGIKGHVFTHDAKAFISGESNLVESVKFGIVGGVQHSQVDYKAVNYTDFSWSPQPSQCVVYASCHDNHTIWDRLINSIPEVSEAQREKMQQLALGIVLTSQGVPFLHAGSEFCRTKQGVENSYNQPDSINQMDWNRIEEFPETTEFVREMIALRSNHPIFRMRTTKEVEENLKFYPQPKDNLIAYQLNGAAVKDSWASVFVIFNGNLNAENVELPEGSWQVKVAGSEVEENGQIGRSKSTKVSIPANSMMILVKE